MRIHALTADDTDPLPALGRLLQQAVDGGASLGFLAPLARADADAYWHGVFSQLGPLLQLWIAEDDGQLLGTVQLARCGKPNGRHRGEVQKLMVAPASRGRGVARRLMEALETAARADGLRLLVLDTQQGSDADAVYHHLGWERAGQIPCFAASPCGELMPTVLFYKLLAP